MATLLLNLGDILLITECVNFMKQTNRLSIEFNYDVSKVRGIARSAHGNQNLKELWWSIGKIDQTKHPSKGVALGPE